MRRKSSSLLLYMVIPGSADEAAIAMLTKELNTMELVGINTNHAMYRVLAAMEKERG